jgi:hypothetical protein
MIIRDPHGVVRGMIDLPERPEGLRATHIEVEIRAGLRNAGYTMAPPEDRTADVLLAAGGAR